ncbi:50S ribosomal protein L9 [candidate division KSB3 bacterium]|uniref:Large ribosomal subunit protein bL9 n=1 Tax=candidate division KSB3 bacterium TaxID=2044937 RepID=A0A2G6KFU6_9BACT|nr:MAG: 50S ribosomal protein L9 [candidate division KSB3 bacterium]
MEIILKQSVDKLGEAGDRVAVSNGYARNFLLPKGIAIQATKQNIAMLEHEKTVIEQRKQKARREAEKVAGKLRSLSCVLKRQVGEQDKLFGSVTSIDIAEFLKGRGIEVERKNILLEEPIKELGTFRIPVRFHPEVTAELKVKVQKEG